MLRGSLVLLIVSTLELVLSQAPVDLCNGAIDVDGTSYKSHEECDKFIECSYDATGKQYGWVRQCSFGTYWNMDLLTCVAVDKAACTRDRCAGKPDGEIYPAANNCRGFWQCAGGKSQPQCCALDQMFDTALSACVADKQKTCKSTSCFPRFVVPTICDKEAIPGKPGFYNEVVSGWGKMERPCAPGTGFHQESCHCLNAVELSKVVRPCKPEIYLPFTTNHMDESGNEFHVKNTNVVVSNGMAYFDGNTSHLEIPRFTNIQHGTTIVINVKYQSNHNVIQGMSQAIVGNNGCSNIPTLLIAEDSSNVYIGVGTDNKTFAYTDLPQFGQDGETREIMYKFANGTLYGRMSAPTGQMSENSVAAPGNFRQARCALQVGFADDLVPFKGWIDELTVYLCDPAPTSA
ncbi:protein PIF-like [Mya arenaria]|nr:protein PIF-like [Mya arenaria]XP_052772763.1 protein PIF-like [Mya arenaria]